MLSSRISFISQPLNNSPLRRATVESVLTGFGGQAVLVISGILVARVLGVEGRGSLAMLVLFPILISQLGELGLPHAMTYYLVTDRDHAKAICHSLRIPFLFQIMILPIIHFCILKLYLSGQHDQIVLAGYFTLIVIPGLLAHRYGLALLQGLKAFRPFNLLRLMPATVYAGTILLIFVVGIGRLPVIIFSWTFINIIIGISTLCFAYRKVSALQLSMDVPGNPSIKKMLHFGIKGLIGALAPVESFRLDQLAAGLLLSPSALGLYVVAQAFTNLPRFISQSTGMVAYPAVGASSSTDAAKSTLWRFILSTSAFNSIVVFLLIVFMPVLIPILFGSEFNESIPLAQLLLLGAFFASCRRILVEGMRGLNRPEVSTWAELSMYPFLAVTGFFLINYFGLTGLSVAVSLSYLVSLLVSIKFLYIYASMNKPSKVFMATDY